ncbi:MAG TPA: hypothetical protein VI039_07545 [Solirubrobacterales bacterium]
MKYPRSFWPAVAVAGFLLMFASTASATTATAPAGTAYSGSITASNEGALTLHGVVDVTCQKSSLSGSLSQQGSGVTVIWHMSSFTMTECNQHVSIVKSTSEFRFHATSGGNGTARWSLMEMRVEFTTIFGNVECTFGVNETDVGAITGAASSSSHATWDINSSPIPVKSGTFLCGSSAELTGKYKFTSPTGLSVDS